MTNVRKFTLLPSYYDAAMALPEELRREFLSAICMYGWTGEEPEFDNPLMVALFKVVKPSIDASADYFESKSKAGQQGGRGKKKQKKANESTKKQEKAKESTEKANESKRKRESSLSLSPSLNGVRGMGEGVDDTPPPVITGLGDFTPADIKRVARECVVDEEFARICLSRLVHWCRLKGRTYPDYYQALSHFIVTDRTYPMQRLRDPEPPTPPIKLPPKVPMTDEEAAKMRACMPAFIANKKIDK